jgi:uncharacterized protein (TIRG00374 family)
MKKHGKYLLIVLKIAVSAALLGWLVLSNFDSLLEVQGQFVKPEYYLIALLVIIVVVPALVLDRWNYFLKLSGIRENFLQLYRIHHVAQFYGLFLPSTSGSIPVQIYMIEKRHPDKKGITGTTVIAEKMFSLFCLVLLALAGSFLTGNIENINYLRLFLALILTGIIFFLILAGKGRKIDWFSRLSEKSGINLLKGILDYVNSLIESFREFPFRKALLNSFVQLLFFQAATVLMVWLIFLSFGENISLQYHFAFVPIGYISALLPVSIGGLGVREGVFVYLYGLIGTDPALSLSVSLANYLALTVTPGLIGGILSIFTVKDIKKISK